MNSHAIVKAVADRSAVIAGQVTSRLCSRLRFGAIVERLPPKP